MHTVFLSAKEYKVFLPFLIFFHIWSSNCLKLSQISEIKMADIPDVDLSNFGVTNYGRFSVEVIDPVSDYVELMEVEISFFPIFFKFLTYYLFSQYNLQNDSCKSDLSIFLFLLCRLYLISS